MAPTQARQRRVILEGMFARGASRRYAAAEPIGIVGFVSQQDCSLA
jgi:hypothetical protein